MPFVKVRENTGQREDFLKEVTIQILQTELAILNLKTDNKLLAFEKCNRTPKLDTIQKDKNNTERAEVVAIKLQSADFMGGNKLRPGIVL